MNAVKRITTTTLTAATLLGGMLLAASPASAQAFPNPPHGCVSVAPAGWWDDRAPQPNNSQVHGHTAYGIHYTAAWTTAC